MSVKGTVFKLALFIGACGAPLTALAQAAPGPQGPAGAAAAQAAPPQAQGSAPATPAAQAVSEVVVTALRRDTTLQRTPAAVTALSGADLASRGVGNVEDLAAVVPDVSFGRNLGQAHIAIRGIGADSVSAGQDPRIAFYQDGVYIGRPDAQLSGLYDVGSVQVLKGPQGTLYGRNATGGAVVVTSAAPTDTPEGFARFGYGNYNAVEADTAVSGEIAPTLSARVALHYDGHDGYGKNVTTGQDIDDRDEFGGRFSLLWKPVAGLKFLTILDYSHEADHGNALHYIGPSQPGAVPLGIQLGGAAAVDSRDIASDLNPKADILTWGIAEHVTYETPWATISSTTSYRKLSATNLVDIDGTSLQLGLDDAFDQARQISEELTASGDIEHLSWLVGGQYFHENLDPAGSQFPINSAAVGGPAGLRDGLYVVGYQSDDSYAGYAQLSYQVLERLKLSVGGRYSTERKALADTFQADFTRPFNPTDPLIPTTGFPRQLVARFSRFTPTATVEYRITPKIFSYFTYGQGFKSGGFNFGVLQPAYAPEKITSYEVGLKSTWLHDAITANIIGFHYDYTDLQVTQVRNNVSVTQNAASANTNGFEIELSDHVTHDFLVGGNFSYLDAHYQDFTSIDPSNPGAGTQNLDGKTLTQAPKKSLALYASQTWRFDDFNLILRGDYSYVGRQYFTPFDNALVSQGAYSLGSINLTLQKNNGWSLEGYVKNLGDTKAVQQAYVSSTLFNSPVLGTLTPPRTFGFTASYSF